MSQILKRTSMALGVCALVAAGCNKKEGAGEAAAEPAAKGAAPATAAAKPTSCPEGTTKNDDYNFCLKLPAGYKELRRQQVGDTTDITYGDPSGSGASPFGVSVHVDQGEFDRSLFLRTDAIKAPNIKVLEEADLPGGGKFVLYNETGDWSYRTAYSHAKGSKVWVICGTQTNLDNPQGDYDTICKSLVAL